MPNFLQSLVSLRENLDNELKALMKTGRKRIRREIYKHFLRIMHGMEYLILGPLTPTLRTPSRIEFMWEKSTLIRYISTRKKIRYSVPVMVIPPLMVKPDIFDLRPGHSFVGHLLKEGFDVFLVDFGIPKKTDKEIALDDYVTDFIPNAVNRIREITKSNEVSLIGWSMGGIFIMLYLGLYGKMAHVRNAVIIASPIDYSKMSPFNLLAGIGHPLIMRLTDRLGNIPPILSKNAFKMLSPIGHIRRYIDLLINLWDREWVAGFETVSQWVEGFIPYPGATFKQFVTDFVKENNLAQGNLKIKDKKVNLKKIVSSILVISGGTDIIAPIASVEPLGNYISSKDVKVLRAPAGHIGLVAGSNAPETVWTPIVDWLSPRSGSI